MTVELRAATIEDVRFIAERMRESDRTEIFATRWSSNPDELAAGVMQVDDFVWTARVDDEPVAVIGARPLWPNVWTVFAFGTDRWGEAALTLSKHVKRFMRPALVAHGVHLALCWSDRRHTDAHGWLKLLGAREEASIAGYGKHKEDFLMFAFRPTDDV